MKEEKLSINNLEVNYKIAGEGPAILVLHGWGGSSDSWREVLKILSGNYKVVVPDLPGFGKTPPPPRVWERKDYIDFILSFLESLKINTFFLVGHSFGGSLAVMLSKRCPERIKKIIFLDASGIKHKVNPKTMMIFWMARIGNAVFSPKHLRRFKDAARNLFYVFLRNRDYVKAKGIMRDTIKNVFAQDLLPELSGVKNQTLIVWGEIDRMVPLKYGRIFNEKIAGSVLKTLPKVGHSPHLEVPEELSRIISSFFK